MLDLATCSGLQRLTLLGNLLVWCGTASKCGACGTIIVGRLGLHWTAAGCSALLGNSGVVHRRKMAQVTTWHASMAAEAVAWVAQRDAVVRRARFGYLMGILKHGATPFIILMAT